MPKLLRLRFLYFSLSFLSYLFLGFSSFAQVSITPAQVSGGSKICIDGAPKTLTDIIIDERANLEAIGGSGNIGSNQIISFVVPAGFEFTSAGSASAIPGNDVTIDNITLFPPNEIQLQIDFDNSGGSDQRDVIIITGIQIQAVAGFSPQPVTITRSGAIPTIDGMPDGTSVGSVSSVLSSSLAVSSSPSPVCSGSSANVTIEDSEADVTYQLKDLSDVVYSAVYAGNGGDLIIPSDPLTTGLTLKVVATYPAGSSLLI